MGRDASEEISEKGHRSYDYLKASIFDHHYRERISFWETMNQNTKATLVSRPSHPTKGNRELLLNYKGSGKSYYRSFHVCGRLIIWT